MSGGYNTCICPKCDGELPESVYNEEDEIESETICDVCFGHGRIPIALYELIKDDYELPE